MSHIWDATIGLLALYEDIQDKMYQEIVRVAPKGERMVRMDHNQVARPYTSFHPEVQRRG